jgi:hypothetical protein
MPVPLSPRGWSRPAGRAGAGSGCWRDRGGWRCDVRAARGAVRVEEDVDGSVAGHDAAVDALDDRAFRQHGPAALVVGLDGVLGRLDAQAADLAGRERFAAEMMHGGGDLPGGAAHLARVHARVDRGHDDRGREPDDGHHDHQLDEREAARGAPMRQPEASDDVTSWFGPSPPGWPSAPSE